MPFCGKRYEKRTTASCLLFHLGLQQCPEAAHAGSIFRLYRILILLQLFALGLLKHRLAAETHLALLLVHINDQHLNCGADREGMAVISANGVPISAFGIRPVTPLSSLRNTPYGMMLSTVPFSTSPAAGRAMSSFLACLTCGCRESEILRSAGSTPMM